MADRTVREELWQAAGDGAQRVLQRRQGARAHGGGRQIGRAARQKPIERAPGHEPPFEKSREPFASAREPELRQHERDVRLVPGQSGENPQRLIQRLLDEPRYLGLVGHLEPGIQVRLERKLAEQRQAERIDRADGDLAEPIAELAPSRLVDVGALRGIPQLARRSARASPPQLFA